MVAEDSFFKRLGAAFPRIGDGMERLTKKMPGLGLRAFFVCMGVSLLIGFVLCYLTNPIELHWIGRGFLSLGESLLFIAVMEYLVLRVLETFRLGALVRVTYYEGLFQPFTIIVLVIGLVCIVAGAFTPFFTLSEDSKMYRDVALQFVLLFSLVIMVFAAGKVVDEEIENRTMLTLLSKPIARWQVIIGKYLGVVCLVLVAVVVLGIFSGNYAYLRFFDDMRIDLSVAHGREYDALLWSNHKAIIGMVPVLTLEFLEIATLAAISVAISTRYGLALNMTVVALLYVGANLTRNVPDLALGNPWQWMVEHLSYLLPYLTNFDLSPVLIYGNFTYGDDMPLGTTTLAQIWEYVMLAGIYAALYIGVALSVGIAMFRTRELT